VYIGNLLLSSYLGGVKLEGSLSIAVQSEDDDICLSGYTSSDDFVTTKGAFQEHYGGGLSDAFITVLTAPSDNLVHFSNTGVVVDPVLNSSSALSASFSIIVVLVLIVQILTKYM
jgi:hypothetical protein